MHINRLISVFIPALFIIITGCVPSGPRDWYIDSDMDGYGNPEAPSIRDVERPSGYVANNQDCDDTNAAINPAAIELDDGYDNNCNDEIDELSDWYEDFDADGFGNPSVTSSAIEQPIGYVASNTDCDDLDPDVHPGAEDIFDGVDNNCDGEVDEGTLDWYADADGDSFGDPMVIIRNPVQPANYVENNRDCNDSDAEINPLAIELADLIDNNCNDEIDELSNWYLDDDGDGYGDSSVIQTAVEAPVGYVGNGDDCDDDNANRYPDNIEVFDDVDNDCDGFKDESLPVPPWPAGADDDGDGIPDAYEAPGMTIYGMPLYEWGARPGQVDLFISLNFMESTNGGLLPPNYSVQPIRETFEKLIGVFAAHNIALHFDVGDYFDQSGDNEIDPLDFDLGGVGEVPYAFSASFQGGRDKHAKHDYRDVYLSPARKQIFYYILYALSTLPDGSAHSGGEASGSTMCVLANGSKDDPVDTEQEIIIMANNQASTTMHEFGHNLGLQHGGDSSWVNHKPNYFSTMNYDYSFGGLPSVDPGDNPADRYYFFNRDVGFCGDYKRTDIPWPSLAKYRNTAEFIIDYSSGTNYTLDEANLDENAGFGPGLPPVDFNCNGVIDVSLVSFDLNRDNSIGVLTDYNDWANLYFAFSGKAHID